MKTYVSSYDHDVFISYSHANNSDGWVTKFRHKLFTRLAECVPPGAKFFRDAEVIQGNHDFSEEIIQGVRNSAVLVVIMSRSYLQRPWCRKECEEFKEANAKKGLNGRIFLVRYDDVSPAQYQDLVGGRIGYDFFSKGEDEKYVQTVDPESERFKKCMNNLREEIGAELSRLNSPDVDIPRHLDAPEPLESRPSVFVAESAPGLGDYTDKLIDYLKGINFNVVRPGERFYELGGYESAFDAGLSRSMAFVQLLGRKFAPRDDDLVQSWDHWQYLRANTSGIPTFRWFNKFEKDGSLVDLQKLDADHRNFVSEKGVWDCEMQRFRELLQTDFESRHHDLRQKERAARKDGSRPLVVLRSDKTDRAYAESIGVTLRQANCDWMNIPDRDIASLEKFAVDVAANGLVVIYHSCPGTWVLARLQELRKFLRTEFGRQWACGLWRAPEDTEDALSCSVDGLFVIETGNTQHIEDFVTKLNGASVI